MLHFKKIWLRRYEEENNPPVVAVLTPMISACHYNNRRQVRFEDERRPQEMDFSNTTFKKREDFYNNYRKQHPKMIPDVPERMSQRIASKQEMDSSSSAKTGERLDPTRQDMNSTRTLKTTKGVELIGSKNKKEEEPASEIDSSIKNRRCRYSVEMNPISNKSFENKDKNTEHPGFLHNPRKGPEIESFKEQCGSYLTIVITGLVSPSEFYIQREPLLEELDILEENMSIWYEEYDEHFKTSPMKFENIIQWGYYVGKPLVIPPSSNGTWVRVQVYRKPDDPSDVLQNGVYCTLIDHGQKQFFECHKIRPLRKCYAELPWVSRKASLSTIDTVQAGSKVGFSCKQFRNMVEKARELKQDLVGMLIDEELRKTDKFPFPAWNIFITGKDPNYNFIGMELKQELKMLDIDNL